MYKRAIVFSVVMATLVSPLARADAGVELTQTQRDLIKANCISVKTTLNRIHANDALSRVHLGQEYETLSTKMMAPMNSRVALNKLNGVELIKTTVEFNETIDEFRDVYKVYEQSLSRALQVKCVDDPQQFYDAIALAQQQRSEVRTTVESLARLVTQYGQQVNMLRSQILDTQHDKEQGV